MRLLLDLEINTIFWYIFEYKFLENKSMYVRVGNFGFLTLQNLQTCLGNVAITSIKKFKFLRILNYLKNLGTSWIIGVYTLQSKPEVNVYLDITIKMGSLQNQLVEWIWKVLLLGSARSFDLTYKLSKYRFTLQFHLK